MKTAGTIIAHPGSSDKFEALKAFMKALNIKFEVNTPDKGHRYTPKIETSEEPNNEEIISNLKKGFEEMRLLKKGKLKTTSLNAFLNEL